MAENMIDLNGLVHVWSKVKTLTDNCVKTTDIATVATSGSYNDLSDKPTIPSAYTLPTASNTVMGGVKIGSNISVSSGTISITKSNVTSALGYTPPTSDTVYNNATTSTAGLMSASDKVKLNSIAANANNYIHPPTHPASMISGLATVATSGNYNDLANKPGDATTSSAGLMSSSDKSKLDSIAANANNYIHPASHPASMITGLAAVATSGSYNDLSDSPAIPVVDDSLSSDSTNAVQNKVVYGLGQKFFNQLSALASVARTGSYSDLTGTPGNATTSAAGLMSAADKAKLDKVDADAGSVKLITYS